MRMEDFSKFVSLKANNKLVAPHIAGSAIVTIAVNFPRNIQGKYVSLDDPVLSQNKGN